MLKKPVANVIIFTAGGALLVALDQWLKLWSVANLQNQPTRYLLRGILHLTYLENTGAAFGFMAGFGGAQWLLAALKLILMVAVVVYYVKLPFETRFFWVRIPLMMIFAGGVGNFIDRVRLGFVVDMLVFRFINFPVFNLADIYVTVGVFFLAFVLFFVVKDAPLFSVPSSLDEDKDDILP